MEETKFCPKVFISYSWDVSGPTLELAKRLMANGVDVIFDKWSLKPGQDKYVFMEQCVSDTSIQKVLIICDKSYTEKANCRTGGVGDETVIISPEVYGKVEQEKFIPIVLEKDENGKGFLPHFINSRIYIDLSEGNADYEAEFEKLLRNIYNKPLYVKPAVGRQPEWLNDISTDYSALYDTIKQISACKAENKNKMLILLKKAESEIVIAVKSFSSLESKSYDEALLDVIDQMKYLRDVIIDYIIILFSSSNSVSDTVTSLFETLYNETHVDSLPNGSANYLIESYDFFIWELFICIAALCLHYEQYETLNKILRHTYFLYKWGYEYHIPDYYERFYKPCKIIENTCKPKSSNPNLFTLQGEMLLQREKKPLITKERLSNADLVLFQLFIVMVGQDQNLPRWFPLTYVYHQGKQNQWVKLASRKYCEKIMPLFGVNTLEDLTAEIDKSNSTASRQGFAGSFDHALRICDSILSKDIGSVV